MIDEVQKPGDDELKGSDKSQKDGKPKAKEGSADGGNETAAEDQAAEDQAVEEQPLDKLAEESDRYMRLSADFENFRKRTARERMELIALAEKDIILSLLPMLDDFERAVKALENSSEEVKKELDGFQLIYDKMLQNLESRGLKAMEAKGKTFDVEYHEAITKLPAPDAKMKNTVLEEIEKGYLLNGTVIRFAKVVIAE